MQVAHPLLLTTLFAMLAGCAAVQTPDATLASNLVGKWSRVRNSECCARYEESIELRADGSFRAAGTFRDATGSTPYSFQGEWKVLEGHLSIVVKKSGGLERPDSPRGESRERVVSVTEWQLVTMDPLTGQERRAWRYPK